MTENVGDVEAPLSGPSVELPVRWRAADSAPVPANQFLIQVEPNGDGSPGGVQIVAGWANVPRMLGSREEQIASMREAGGIEVIEVASIIVNRQRVQELHEALGRVMAQWDASGVTARPSHGGDDAAATG